MKLTKRILSLGLAIGMMLTMSVGVSASSFSETYSGHKLNMVATNLSNVYNGTKVSTWNTSDYSGTQDWVVSVDENCMSLSVKGKPSYVLSYNRYTTQPEIWTKGYDNPVSEYSVRVGPYFVVNSPIQFDRQANWPGLYITNSRISYGSEFGYRIGTTTNPNQYAIWAQQ